MSEKDLEEVKNFYNARFAKEGRSLKSVGWSDEEGQRLRFDIISRGIDYNNKTILDLGCGLADFEKYLNDKGFYGFTYIGVDISDALIEECVKSKTNEKSNYYCGEIFDFDFPEVDITVSSGALTIKMKDNESYAQKVIDHLFSISIEVVSINFMSSYCDYKLEKNHHYSPEKIFSFSKKLSRFVNIFHDYKLWEFTLQIFKEPRIGSQYELQK